MTAVSTSVALTQQSRSGSLYVVLAPDVVVDPADPGGHGLGGRLGAEDDRVGRREGAPQPPERIAFEVAVLGHPGRHLRMGQLQEQGPPAAQEDGSLGVDPPDHGVGAKRPATVATVGVPMGRRGRCGSVP